VADDAILNEQLATRMNLALWRKLLRLARPYWPHMGGIVAAALIVATCDISFPLVTGAMINRAVDPDAGALWPWALAFALIGATLATTVCGFILLAGRIATGVGHELRRAGFDRLQELEFGFFDRHAVGWLLARLTSDCDRLSRVIGWALLDLAWGTMMLSAAAGVMLFLDWRTGLAVLLVLPALAVVSLIAQRKILLSSRDMRKINSHLTAEFNESIAGAKTTKTLVREDDNLAEFKLHSTAMYGASMRNAIQTAVYVPLVMVMVGMGEAMAVGVGGSRALGGSLSVGVLVTFMYYAKMLPDPIREAAHALTQVLGAQAAAERVVGLLETQPAIVDPPEVRDAVDAHARGDRAADPALAPDGRPVRIRRIEFRAVSFAYQPDEPVLERFNLTVEPGQTIALVGPTGGGKSTIVSLLARFYEPTAGEILVDGVDYRRRPLRWWQGQFGVVLQQPHLFSGTIRENIRYGRLDATDDEVEQAARLVNAHAFIEQMERGYDTPVGQGGASLSSGQRQLISFARAVLAQPQIMILDEATSSIDTETEQLIQTALHRVLEGRIAFVIAHRLSTIRSADRILVIDGGRIVESGTHQELLRRGGRYHALYTGQFTREHEDAALAP